MNMVDDMSNHMTDHMTNDGLITVTVPVQMRKRGGRRRIIVPDLPPESSRTYAESLAVAIARAHHWKALIDSGKFASISELAIAIGLDFSYAARIYRLTYLAPDIIEAILDGREPGGVSMRVLCKPAPMEWDEQRELLGFHSLVITV